MRVLHNFSMAKQFILYGFENFKLTHFPPKTFPTETKCLLLKVETNEAP